MNYPDDWPEGHADKIQVMNHFQSCPNFEGHWNGWTPQFKSLFFNFVFAVHSARFDWYGTLTGGGDLRIGYKGANHINGTNFARVVFNAQGHPTIVWTYPQEIGGPENGRIDIPLVNSFSDPKFLGTVRTTFAEHGGTLRTEGEQVYWPDGQGETIKGDKDRGDKETLKVHSKMNLNTILYGPPGTGKTHSVTALTLSILSQPEQQAQYRSDLILSGKPPVGQLDEWRIWVDRFKDFVKAGRIEFTTFHQNYSYEDFVEGLKASVIETPNGSAVVYEYESGILKRIAYRALYAWLTGGCPEASSMSETELEVVRLWLNEGALPVVKRDVNGFSPPYVLIIDEINRGNVARIFGELITLVEGSKRARLKDEIDIGHQPLAATLPYTKKPFILPPNLYIIGTMNTADRSLVGLDAALRRRFEFIELSPQPELLRTIGDAGNEVDLSQLLIELNKRIVDAEKSTDHEIGHAYFLGVGTMEDLASVMSRQVIPQLREYFFDQREKVHAILAPRSNSSRSPFIDERGKPDIRELGISANYRSLYGAG